MLKADVGFLPGWPNGSAAHSCVESAAAEATQDEGWRFLTHAGNAAAPGEGVTAQRYYILPYRVGLQ